MPLHQKLGLAALVGFLGAGAALAQSFGVGASIGVVNDVSHQFHIDEFSTRDLNAWLDCEVEDKVILRATVGRLRMKGVNAGQVISSPFDPNTVTLPDLTNIVDYGTVGVAYEFIESGYMSGLFAGVGGYNIRPEAADPAIANYRDPRETVFGWHVGVDGSARIVSRLSFLVRLTYHNIRSSSGRSLLTANGGLSYRF